MSDESDPVRFSEGDERELVQLLEAARPPELPASLRAKMRARLDHGSAPRWQRAAPWLALAAIVALVIWRWPSAPTERVASPILVPEPVAAPDAAVDAGPSEPPTLVPDAWPTGTDLGIEVVLELTAVDPGSRAIALVLLPADEDGAALVRDCSGELLAELPADVFRSALPYGLSLAFRFEAPVVTPGRHYVVATCSRDAMGRLLHEADWNEPSVTAGRHETATNLPRIATPSGETTEVQTGHLVVGARLIDGEVTLVEVRVMELSIADTEVVELTLDDASTAWLSVAQPAWVPDRGFVPADQIAVGEEVVGTRGRHRVTGRRIRSDATVAELRVTSPDTYFADDVLVHDARLSRAPDGDARPLVPHDEPVAVLPIDATECSLVARLRLDEAAVEGDSLWVRTAPHRGAPGTLRTVSCDDADAHTALRLPAALLRTLREIEGAEVQIELPAWDETFDDWHPLGAGLDRERPGRDALRCSTAYTVQACIERDGVALPIDGGTGRYAITGAACFASGTAVLTPDGERAIESLRPGDRVLTLVDGATRAVPVRALLPRGERPIIELALESGEVLRLTAEHPLYDPHSGTFRPAGELHAGDVLLGADGEVTIALRIDRGETAPVYDLSVEAPHTYLAGGILAHNY